MGIIVIGISSWTEPTLIKGGKFYPPSAKSAEARLRYYASQFPIVEVDSTYYGLPMKPPRVFGSIGLRTNSYLTLKPSGFLPSILLCRQCYRKTFESNYRRKARKAEPSITGICLEKSWANSGNVLNPLFCPWTAPVNWEWSFFSFLPGSFPAANRGNTLPPAKKFPQYHVAVEFRHQSWLNEKNRQRTLDFLKENKLAYVCVDDPRDSSPVSPVTAATSDIGVVRFHGRNQAAWEGSSAEASGRFNYLYSEEELKEWQPRIKELSSQTRELHVIFNNCYDDKAVRNARQTRMLFD